MYLLYGVSNLIYEKYRWIRKRESKKSKQLIDLSMNVQDSELFLSGDDITLQLADETG